MCGEVCKSAAKFYFESVGDLALRIADVSLEVGSPERAHCWLRSCKVNKNPKLHLALAQTFIWCCPSMNVHVSQFSVFTAIREVTQKKPCYRITFQPVQLQHSESSRLHTDRGHVLNEAHVYLPPSVCKSSIRAGEQCLIGLQMYSMDIK